MFTHQTCSSIGQLLLEHGKPTCVAAGRGAPALGHVGALAAQHVAGACVAVHVPAEHQIYLVLVQQALQLPPQVLYTRRGDADVPES